MIEMIAGVFGLPINGIVKAMDKLSGPFEAGKEQEARLVKLGLARYIAQPQNEDEQSDTDNAQPQNEDEQSDTDNAQLQNEDDGAPIGFDEMPPEDFAEDVEDEADVMEEFIDLETLTGKELREIGAELGLTFKANAKKAEMIAAITAEQGKLAAAAEDAPTFDAAEAVEE